MKFAKKIWLSILSVCVLALGFALWTNLGQSNLDKQCAFCNPEVIQTHTFYEDNLVRGMCSYKPVQPGHCLVVVKRHIKTFDNITDEETLAVGRLLKKINTAIQKINGPSAYMIMQKNGGEVGQTVPHVHFHYIPKKSNGNKIAMFGLFWNFFIDAFKKPMSKEKLAKWVDKMKSELLLNR